MCGCGLGWVAGGGGWRGVWAGKFSTSVKRVLGANPGLSLAPQAEVPPGTLMCILPCTASDAPFPAAA